MRPPLRSLLVVLLLSAAAAAWSLSDDSTASVALQAPAKAQDAKAKDAKPLDVNDCKTCHEQAFSNPFMHSMHAGLEQRCESCHKGAAQHAQTRMEGNEDKPPSLKALPAAEIDKTCLTCHDKGRQANWHGGMHERRQVTCISCHSVHSSKSVQALLKTPRETETCTTCHTQIRSKLMRVSHHPVREGLMGCASCHDPHDGTKTKMVSANWVNEKCYECHTEKRGPFLWEHAPVRENCMNCHDPHGSNHEKLLQAKQPYLCQRCHLNTRHPGTLYDGRNAVLASSVSNRAVEHGCRNCHQNIHGGNAPSGPYLGR
jgi:DmsE family decaheme c-type cytochrome